MRALAANGSFHVALLDGVTGSGKTEVYFEAVAEIIRRGKQSLILMPEIALTGQFLDRFAVRFGVRPLEWHSELTPRTRARNWAAIAAGEAHVVVGARSALFLPYANLGLIVVDEEHDQAYKQDDGAHYHARDMAVVRANIAKIPVLLASATPSVETEVNARKGRYQRIVLPQRFGGQHMPHIEAIDLRREAPAARTFYLAAAGRGNPHRGGAARAGAAVPQSPRLCATNAVPDLRKSLRLHDLDAGWSTTAFASAWSVITAASRCRARTSVRTARRKSLVAVVHGVERLQEEASALFPDARTDGAVERPDHLDRDHAQRAQRDRCGPRRYYHRHRLVAKGHNFPRLNLVGVVDADLGLSNGDPRAAERTFQLLNQVIGRAGREQGRGVGYLQTPRPEHPVMKALVACDRGVL